MFELDDQARMFGATAVENLLFTDYLPDASGEQVKVSLWGLYHSRQGTADCGLGQMSEALGLEEAQVEAALRYWERRRLVERVSDKPLRYVYHSLVQRALTGQEGLEGDRAFILFNDAVYAQFDGRRKLRPNDIAWPMNGCRIWPAPGSGADAAQLLRGHPGQQFLLQARRPWRCPCGRTA